MWRELRAGDEVVLEREAKNRYDQRAVRVRWRGRSLGYIPRRENAAVAQLLDLGHRVDARIVRLSEGGDPWQRVRVALELVV